MSDHLRQHSFDESMDELPPSSLAPPGRSGASSSQSSIGPSSSSSSSSVASGASDASGRFHVLLLCESRLYFELVTIAVDDLALRGDSTVYDVLRYIPRKCSEKRLLNNQYVGFVRTSDQVIFTDLDVRAFRPDVAEEEEGGPRDQLEQLRQGGFLRNDTWTEREYIEDDDVLVAVLEGYSAHGMLELSEPVLRNPNFADVVCKRGGKGGDDYTEASNRSSKNNPSKPGQHYVLDDLPPPHSPPGDAFQSMDVMGVERASSLLSENTPVRQEYVDFLDENDKWLTLEYTKNSDEEFGEGVTFSRGGISGLFPIFNSKGKFVKHDFRGTSEDDAPGLASSSVLSGRSGSPEDVLGIGERLDDAAARHRKKRNSKFVLLFALLMFVVVIASALFLAGDKKRETTLLSREPVIKESGDEGIEFAATPSVAESTPKPTNVPVSLTPHSTALAGVASLTHKPTHRHHANWETKSPTNRPTHKEHTHPVAHRSTGMPTHKPTHKKHHNRRPTGRPTHKKHDHDHRLSSTPTEKPTHKRHDHGDGKPTGRPTHKEHDHDHRLSSTPTEKPTHKRHHHSDHTSEEPEESPSSSDAPVDDTQVSGSASFDEAEESPSSPDAPVDDTQVSDSASSNEPEEGPSSPDAPVDDTQVSDSASDTLVHIKPRALVTIDRSNPDFKFGGLEQLDVHGDERFSFLHFSLSKISGDAVDSAALNLYLTAYDGDDAGNVVVAVDMLPRVGDWSVGEISWNESLDAEDPFLANRLVALPLEGTEQLYEVDVTPAILRTHQWVTFRFSVEFGGGLSFASKNWNGGEFLPELVVTLAS